ncbi:hypothetical protein Ciccas_007171 [Cichlidogyrus casuarinus]|uniref:Ig-like domain-containing protein n=1 Tax=Cichlidogyrus casuarinus TaxID=1844966 RepID=A0ABD2Q3S0_9PLAT
MAMDGKNLILTCRCTGDPAPNFVWSFNGKAVADKANKCEMVDSMDGAIFVRILKLMAFAETDYGHYKLVATNASGEAISNMIINPPKLTGKPVVKQVDNNKRAVFELKYQSLVKCNIIWMFNGQEIKPGGRIFMDQAHEDDNYVAVLEIDGVRMHSFFWLPAWTVQYILQASLNIVQVLAQALQQLN